MYINTNVTVSAKTFLKGTWILDRNFDFRGFKTCETLSVLNPFEAKSLTTYISNALNFQELKLDAISLSYDEKKHKV